MFDTTLIDEVKLKGKRVFMRVDFNVPLDKKGKITDNGRIKAAVPTIKYALQEGAKCVVLASHLGRPNGQVKAKFSLRQIVDEVSSCLGISVTFLPECIGPDTEAKVNAGSNGSVFLLENLRFHIEEQGKGKDKSGKKIKAKHENVKKFRESLSRLGDVYINDAFGTCHRKHSSMVGVNLPVKAAGFLIKKELESFQQALAEPKRPFVAVLGGKKVRDKLPLIKNLINIVDEVIISGAMAWTFLKVLGMDIGTSIYDEPGGKLVPQIFEMANKHGVRIYLPVDSVATPKFDAYAEWQIVTRKEGIPKGWMGLDIGPRSQEIFQRVILGARTVIYNGPQGVFEMAAFANGTRALLRAMAEATEIYGCCTIVGGGDSASAARKFGYADRMQHVSTGGGASLELLQGKILPGISHLDKGRGDKIVSRL
mmetsp:Transcript_4800/g.8726  ORF Transcript_4800/g.8726 Transcript_4800/m.8726 type:complete len:425 (+) Transcript_4800:101-1375(+)